jgi:hypothetical protein
VRWHVRDFTIYDYCDTDFLKNLDRISRSEDWRVGRETFLSEIEPMFTTFPPNPVQYVESPEGYVRTQSSFHNMQCGDLVARVLTVLLRFQAEV